MNIHEPQLLGNYHGDDVDDNEGLDLHDDHDNDRDETGNAAKQ
jgi:hypothetical protein